jgi:type I restriction enzyme S subunit
VIESVKPYEQMKPSGLPWVAQIPVGWEVLRAKSVFAAIDERSTTGGEELLTVSSAKGIVPRSSSNVTMFKANSYIGHKLCSPGDLVVNSLWAWAGGLGVSSHRGIISTAYSVYRPRPQFSCYADYLNESLRSFAYKWEFTVRSKGIWISRLQLSDESFMAMPVLLPPSEEQQAIVDFLLHAELRINHAIAAKRKTIGLLNEQKQAIIHQAVTRGLDPTVPLKPSGIPWQDQIPVSWEVLRAKAIFDAIDERSATGEEELLTVSSAHGIVPRSSSNVTMFKANSYVGHKLCSPGDLVVNSLWAWAGGLGVSSHRGIISTAYSVYRPKAEFACYAEYLHEALRSLAYKWELAVRSKGIWVSRLQLSDESFMAMPLLLPPREEAERIIGQLRASLSDLNTSVLTLERECELLTEYRTRLTSDVVTGKLDVRAAAKSLPEGLDEATGESSRATFAGAAT